MSLQFYNCNNNNATLVQSTLPKFELSVWTEEIASISPRENSTYEELKTIDNIEEDLNLDLKDQLRHKTVYMTYANSTIITARS